MEDRQITTDVFLEDIVDNNVEGKKEKIKVITPYIIVSAVFALIALIVYLISRSSVSFAEFYSRTVPSQDGFHFLLVKHCFILSFRLQLRILFLL